MISRYRDRIQREENEVLNIGQKVICVDDRRRKVGSYSYAHEALPKISAVYTIRAIVPRDYASGFDEDGLHLVEIANSPRLYRTPSGPIMCELFFRASRFRPVRTTNIDVFRTMLEPVPVREPAELADA